MTDEYGSFKSWVWYWWIMLLVMAGNSFGAAFSLHKHDVNTRQRLSGKSRQALLLIRQLLALSANQNAKSATGANLL